MGSSTGVGAVSDAREILRENGFTDSEFHLFKRCFREPRTHGRRLTPAVEKEVVQTAREFREADDRDRRESLEWMADHAEEFGRYLARRVVLAERRERVARALDALEDARIELLPTTYAPMRKRAVEELETAREVLAPALQRTERRLEKVREELPA